MTKFNAGEWSEAYLLLRLVGDGRIYAGNENLERSDDVYMDIKSVLKRNVDNVLECNRKDCVAECWLLYDDGRKSEHIIVPVSRFSEMADILLQQIKNRPKKGSFSAPEPYEFLKSIGNESIKAGKPKKGSPYEDYFKGKTDIVLRVVYQRENSTLGFSVKSALGSSPTLFNTASASAFEFCLENCTKEDFVNLNNLLSASGHPDVMKRVEYIRNHNIKANFTHTRICLPSKKNKFTEKGPHFEWNITLLDTIMPKVLAEAILIRYGYYGTNCIKCTDIISDLCRLNPLRVRNPKIFYRTKLEDFVYASFGQMTASEEWDGRHIINGGYIEIKKNGEILYYRANSDDKFKNYLITKTYFESPSTNLNDKKYYHGIVWTDGNKYYLSLNFSVRFYKYG